MLKKNKKNKKKSTRKKRQEFNNLIKNYKNPKIFLSQRGFRPCLNRFDKTAYQQPTEKINNNLT